MRGTNRLVPSTENAKAEESCNHQDNPIQEENNTQIINILSQKLSIPITLANILVQRQINTLDKARVFFQPVLTDLYDPYKMDQIDVAVKRILVALENNEHITIFGDYDVDGTNGTAMLLRFFKNLDANIDYFIPDRIKDGYGLSTAGIEYVSKINTKLLITVDCGITSIEQVKLAQLSGIDVIICDHHETGNTIPDAIAVLDTLKSNCSYPFKYLCGCGVAFKLIQALLKSDYIINKLTNKFTNKNNITEQILMECIQYATLATTADIVPLIDENRIIVKLGLELINNNPLPGIRALIETSGLTLGKISTGQLVFILAPRINAVGRLGDATRAVELLASNSYDKALEIAKVMEDENYLRRKIDEETFTKAQDIVNQNLDIDKESAIVIHQKDWHPGVIGIVASRLVERYYRPTILMTTIDGVAKGSARSIPGFNIYEALKLCKDKILQFGGHKYAAGLTIELDRIDEFRQSFINIASGLLTEELLTPEISIDAEIQLSEISPKFIQILKEFAPFGPENMRPVFATRNVEVAGHPRIVGKNHLRFKVKNKTHIFDAIGFNLGHLLDFIRLNKKVDIAYSLDEGEFAGESIPQLKIRDIKQYSAY